MDFVCIDRLVGDGLRARTLAVYFDGKFEDNIEYALKILRAVQWLIRKFVAFPKSPSSLPQ